MNRYIFYRIFLFMLLISTMTSCEVVGGIFKAGVWVGVIIVIAVVAFVFWLFKKMMD